MKTYLRYVFGVLAIILVVVLLVVGFNAIRKLLSSNGPVEQQTTKKVDLLAAPAANQAVQYTVRGAIVGNEEHRSIRITIDRNTRRVEILAGYNDQVINTLQIANTQDAYQAFIEALQGSKFTKTVAPEGRGIEAQVCPLGQHFIFELAPGMNDSFRSWATSCSAKQGTMVGNRTTIQTLFQRQFPTYNQFVSGVQLN